MAPDETQLRERFQDMNDHDKLTEVLVRVEIIQQKLGGNGGPGLCERVDGVEKVTDRHSVYFTILIGAVPVVIMAIDILMR